MAAILDPVSIILLSQLDELVKTFPSFVTAEEAVQVEVFRNWLHDTKPPISWPQHADNRIFLPFLRSYLKAHAHFKEVGTMSYDEKKCVLFAFLKFEPLA
jgi:hypothetical protein